MTIVFCPGKLIGCPGYFFHDLGRIHASLIRLPYCSTLMSLGLVVLLLSLTSAPIAWLSPQVWLARSTCVLGLRQSNWQFQMGQSLIIACVLYCPLLFHWYNVILRLPSLGLGTSNKVVFICWVDYVLEGSAFILSKCDFSRMFHTERSWHAYRLTVVNVFWSAGFAL